MIFLGIDNGLDGAVAAIETDGGQKLTIWDTPTVRVGGRREYVVPAMVELLEQNIADSAGGFGLAVLEDVFVMPKVGKRTAISLGRSRGLWEGILAAGMIPTRIVRPRAWRSVMLEGTPKSATARERAKLAAMRLWPRDNDKLCRKAKQLSHDRCEAALMAGYAQHIWQGDR